MTLNLHWNPRKIFNLQKLDINQFYFQCVEVDWNQDAANTLKSALRVVPNTNRAKNVIMFLGDGMGITTITAARIYKGQLEGNPGEETKLNFETFPHVALSKVRIEHYSFSAK